MDIDGDSDDDTDSDEEVCLSPRGDVQLNNSDSRFTESRRILHTRIGRLVESQTENSRVLPSEVRTASRKYVGS